LKFEEVDVGTGFSYDDVWFNLDKYDRSISIPGLGMTYIDTLPASTTAAPVTIENTPFFNGWIGIAPY
jgi:hypothetical protein